MKLHLSRIVSVSGTERTNLSSSRKGLRLAPSSELDNAARSKRNSRRFSKVELPLVSDSVAWLWEQSVDSLVVLSLELASRQSREYWMPLVRNSRISSIRLATLEKQSSKSVGQLPSSLSKITFLFERLLSSTYMT